MATTDKNYLAVVHKELNTSLEKQVAALPKEFNKPRFLQNCMTVMQDGQADFSKCDASTVVRTLLKGAFLGLDFFNGECYAIPYGGNCQFQTDYKGEIKLCKRYSKNSIKDIYAKVVREEDFFEVKIEDGRQSVNFKPLPFNDGEILGAFAIVLYADDSMMFDTMSKAEIEHTRQSFSTAKDSKAWKESFGEMCKKTVLRRLCKLIDLDFDTAEQCQAFEDGSEFDVKGKPKEKYQAKDVYGEQPHDQGTQMGVENPDHVIDGEFKEVGESNE